MPALTVPPLPPTRPEDVPLHEDVRRLAATLGSVIGRLEGAEALETVDGLRRACRARRRGDPDAPTLEALLDRVAALPLGQCAVAARAFTLFFLLINTAEQVHRVRRRQDYLRQGGSEPQPASARWAMRQLHNAGHTAEEVARAVGGLDVRPVLTAHPTESTRRTLLALQARVADLLLARAETAPAERVAIDDALEGEVELLWLTAEVRQDRPSVRDEVSTVLWYLETRLLDATARAHDALVRAFDSEFGEARGEVRGEVRDGPEAGTQAGALVTRLGGGGATSRRESGALRLATPIRLGNWVGGDRDGNPFVTPDVTVAAARRASHAILGRYRGMLEGLVERISVSAHIAAPADALRASLDADRAALPDVWETNRRRNADEPLRLKLTFMAARVDATRRLVASRDAGRPAHEPAAYPDAAAFERDLGLVRDSLLGAGATEATRTALDPLLASVRAHGFHGFMLDVRDHADNHKAALDDIVAQLGFVDSPVDGVARSPVDGVARSPVDGVASEASPGTASPEMRRASPEERLLHGVERSDGGDRSTPSPVRGAGDAVQATPSRRRSAGEVLEETPSRRRAAGDVVLDLAGLRRELLGRRPLIGPHVPLADATRRVLDTFAAVRTMQDEAGPAAASTYIVSMTTSAEDLLRVLVLAREAGLVDLAAEPPVSRLDVVPLFETLDDLVRAPDVMRALLADPVYARQLAARGRRQEVMIGYSDSGKDAGILASSWALYRGQEALAALFRDSGVELRLFHGRGGSVGRGGGSPVYRALAALPPDTVEGRVKITEQGEIISQQFGLLPIAERTMEVTLAGTLLQQFADWRESVEPEEAERFRAVMDELSARALAVYRELVHEGEALFGLFERATPIAELADARFGSRPAYRPGAKAGITGIRAIPWGFGWTQIRLMLTGWLGVGTALDALTATEEGVATLRRMARAWPFFDDLLAKIEMVCAKADLEIARAYVDRLGDDADRALLARLEAEFARAVRGVLRVRDAAVLIGDNPVLQAAIALRNPYVDPLSLLQITLLARKRAGALGEDDAARVTEALATTLSGIAQGLRNTG